MKEFYCGCREWVVHPTDIVIETENIDDDIIDQKIYAVDHRCENLKVIRRKQGLARTYYVKRKEQYDADNGIWEIQRDEGGRSADELPEMDSHSRFSSGDYGDSEAEGRSE